MNWWDGLEDWQINTLKENERPLGLLSAFEQKIMQQIDANDLQIFWKGKWDKTELLEGTRGSDRAYRLRPDWQRPKEKEEGHWEYCDVFGCRGFWEFIHDTNRLLFEALGMPGFGGVEYEEFPDKWFSDIGVQAFMTHGEYTPDHGQIVTGSLPATPKRVRFLVKK